MRDYIFKEQESLMSIINNRHEQYKNLSDDLYSNEWHIYSTGSSKNAVLAVQNYLRDFCKLKITIVDNYSKIYYEKELSEKGISVAISQSGSSTSTIRAIKEEKRKKIGFTSNLESYLAAECDGIIDLGIGIEKVGYVTLGYSATLLNLILFGLETSNRLKLISKKEYDSMLIEIKNAVSMLQETFLTSERFIKNKIGKLSAANQYIGISHGEMYWILKEMDTKFIETIRRPVNIRELDEFMHGQYLQINDRQQYILIETGYSVLDQELLKLGSYIKQFNENVITIGTKKISNNDYLSLVAVNEYLQPLITIVPIQLMAYEVSESINSDYMGSKFKDFGKYMNSKERKEDNK